MSAPGAVASNSMRIQVACFVLICYFKLVTLTTFQINCWSYLSIRGVVPFRPDLRQKLRARLRQYIAPVYKNVAPRHVRRGVARQVQIQALDLLDMALPPHSRHAICLVECERTSPHLRIEEPGRNDIHPGELPPFTGQRLGEVRNTGLGRVVDGLINRHIDDVTAHAGCHNQVAKSLLAKDLAGIFGAKDDAVD